MKVQLGSFERDWMQRFLACGVIGEQQYSSSGLQAHNQLKQIPAYIAVKRRPEYSTNCNKA
jgi:hypothetical protein